MNSKKDAGDGKLSKTLNFIIAEMTMTIALVMMKKIGTMVVAIVMVTLMVINVMVMMEMMKMTILSGSRPPASEAE